MQQIETQPKSLILYPSAAVLFVVILLVTPPLLVFAEFIPAEYHWYHLYPVLLAGVWSIWFWVRFPKNRHVSWCSESLKQYGLILVGVSAGCLALISISWSQIDFHFPLKIFLVGMIISFLQELVFREYLVRFLKYFNVERMIVVLVSGVTFSLIHLFFPGQYLALILFLTFLYGSWLAWVYYSHPRLWLAWATHAPANILLTSTGVFW